METRPVRLPLLPLRLTLPKDCATGLTNEGKTPKDIVERMVKCLDSREVT